MPGYNCDEYPFATTTTTDKTSTRYNRCVPSSQNSAQGAQLGTFYNDKTNGCGGQYPCTFTVVVTNDQNLSHCTGMFDCSDSNQVRGPSNADKRAASAQNATVSGGRRFRTNTGYEFQAPWDSEMAIGEIVSMVVPINETLYEEHLESHVYQDTEDEEQFRYMFGNLRLEAHVIAETV